MINWFNHLYPYSNLHELNLDWVIDTVKHGEKEIADFIGVNTIKYADPILWNIESQYEANTVVVDGQTGNAYISVKAVPSGIHINRTEYWTQIYNYANVVDTLREQIAHNEGDTTTATQPFAVGDLVFVKTLLYRVIAPMIAGDSFVENSNIVKTTIEDELKANIQAIQSEASARQSADTQLQHNIDDEVAARSQADTQLQGNIDDEVAARSQADTQLQGNIDALESVVNNLDINHVYNQSTPGSGLTTNIGLKEGTYNITENTTINAQLVVPKGAIINVAEGVTLTINGEILAGRYTIFTGNGSIVVNSDYQDFGYPEWFNNDVIKCYEVFNNIKLGAKDYVVNGDLHLNRTNSSITGVCYGTYMGNNNKTSRLLFSSGRLIIGRYDTFVINDYPRNISVKDVTIDYTGTLEAISIYGVVRCLFENCYVYVLTTNNASRAFHCMQAIGSYLNRCYVQVLNNTTTFYGYDIDNTGNYVNASVWLTECTFGDTGAPTGRSYGFYLHGSRVSDIYLDKCEVAVANIGLLIEGLTNNSVDILINQCDFDSIKEQCILILDCVTNGAISFTNCYCAPDNDSTQALFQIYHSNIPIIARAMQLITTDSSQIGVQAVNCTPRLIGDFIIRNSNTPIAIDNSGNVSIEFFNSNNYYKFPTP